MRKFLMRIKGLECKNYPISGFRQFQLRSVGRSRFPAGTVAV